MIEPRQLLSLSDDLSRGRGEPYARAAISRAYYAAYHSAKPYSDFSPVPWSGNEGAHGNVVKKLAHWPVRRKHKEAIMALRTLGAILGDLKAKRHDADYMLTRDIRHEDAELAVRQARDILARLSGLGDAAVLQAELIT